MLPAVAAVLVILTVAVITLAILLARREHRAEAAPIPVPEPREQLIQAVLRYAQELADEGRHVSLLKLRSSSEYLLNTQAAHDVRRKLGALAQKSASAVNDDAVYNSILIDDLGWAAHLDGDDETAVRNIKHAISRIGDPQLGQDPALLVKIKAYRHLAIIDAKNEASVEGYLENARSLIDRLQDKAFRNVETAQLNHATATIAAIKVGVMSGGRVAASDAQGVQQLQQAMSTNSEAVKAFRENKSRTRYTKSLYLQLRLAEALGDELKTQEVKFELEEAEKQTSWHLRNPIPGV